MLTFAYVIGIGISIKTASVTVQANNYFTKNHHEYKTGKFSLLSHTIPTENISFSDNTLSTSLNIEDTPFSIFTTVKQREQFFNVAYKQYDFNHINTLISYRKKDIIYPFHYFW